jgi:hypothetical protein
MLLDVADEGRDPLTPCSIPLYVECDMSLVSYKTLQIGIRIKLDFIKIRAVEISIDL